jgi:Kinesin-like protein
MDPSLNFSLIRERLVNIADVQSIPTEHHTKKTVSSPSTPSPFKKGRRQKKFRSVAPLPDIQPPGGKTPIVSKYPNREKGREKGSGSKRDIENRTIDGVQFTGTNAMPSLGRPKQSKAITTKVEFETILRVRPLAKEEINDDIVLTLSQSDTNSVLLHELRTNRTATPRQKNKHMIDVDGPSHFSFDRVIGPKTSQEEMYHEIGGQSIAQESFHQILHGIHNQTHRQMPSEGLNLEAKNHVIISMGVSNSGKTFTLIGDGSESNENEGVIPRLIDDLFAHTNDEHFLACINQPSLKNNNHKTQINLEVEISMVHVHKDRVFDMLSLHTGEKRSSLNSNVSKMINAFETTPKEQTFMKELKISQDKTTQDFFVQSNAVRCRTPEKAREILFTGMQQNTVASTKLNKRSSRGHTLVTLRPILHIRNPHSNRGSISLLGGYVAVIDMAGIERTHSNDMNRLAIKESVSINSSISAVLQCLRSIKNNQESQQTRNLSKKMSLLVPYRQNKLTMIMQPLFSGSISKDSMTDSIVTNVKILASVYPGGKDYNEKKCLLCDIEPIRGLSIPGEYDRHSRNTRDNLSTSTMNDHSVSSATFDAPTDKIKTVGAESCYRTNDEKATLDEEFPIQRSVSDENTEASSPGTLSSALSPTHQHKSPLSKLTNVVKQTNISSKKRKAETNALLEKIRKLEAENRHLKVRNNEMEKKCKILERQSTTLRSQLDEAKAIKKEKQSTKCHTEHDDEQFLKSREWRWKHHNLLASPLVNHMKAVEGASSIIAGRLGARLTNKSPFKLNAPTKRRIKFTEEDHRHVGHDNDEIDSIQDSASA